MLLDDLFLLIPVNGLYVLLRAAVEGVRRVDSNRMDAVGG